MKEFQKHVLRKEALMAQLSRGEFNQEDWVSFINEARRDNCPAMANDMERRYVYYLRKVHDDIQK